MVGLTARGIAKRFGATTVLDGLDLDIRAGEFMTLLGPSGCGKSSLLRIIAGLERADRGTVMIGDRVVDSLSPKDRDVAMVFQTYALYPHMTVAENIALPLRMRRLSRIQRLPLAGRFALGARALEKSIRAEVETVAATLGLELLLQRKPAQLSGGQRQRVALGRAMVRHPAVFLMDEPLSNLDAERRTGMRDEIASLHRRLGVTTLYVTHDQTEAMTLSDRIAVMDRGRILQVGTPEEIYAAPAHVRVAEFVGAPKINLIKARLSAGFLSVDGRAIAELSADTQDVDVRLAVRPEALRLVERDPLISTHLSRLEHLGAESHLYGDAGISDRPLAVRCAAAETRGLSIGQPIGLGFDLSAALLFDQQGRRIAFDVRQRVCQ